MPRTIDDIADDYVTRSARLDPVAAAMYGIPGHEGELTDYSPVGAERRAELDRDTLAALAGIPVESDRDRRAAEAIRDRLERQIERHESGEHRRDLSNIFSPVPRIRGVFDNMPRATAAD